MGLFGGSDINTTIIGKRNGQIIYREQFNCFGTITGSYQSIDQRISYLNSIYPGLDWEYESWKD